MATLKFSKVNVLPGSLVSNTVYLVKNGNSIDMFVSDSTGTSALPVGEQSPHPFLFLAAISQGAS